jgi:hypothetical protein
MEYYKPRAVKTTWRSCVDPVEPTKESGGYWPHERKIADEPAEHSADLWVLLLQALRELFPSHLLYGGPLSRRQQCGLCGALTHAIQRGTDVGRRRDVLLLEEFFRSP